MSLLEIHGLTKHFGGLRALSRVSCTVEAGQITGLIGPNGAGKTTLFHVISGQVRPDAGRVLFQGEPIHHLSSLNTLSGLLRPRAGSIRFQGKGLQREPPHRIVEAGLIHIAEGRQLFPSMTILENLELGAYPKRARAARHETLAFVLDLFPRLRERQGQVAGTLSGGEQQMLAIGRGLMARPLLLLLDEPSLGLAPLVVTELFACIRRIHANRVTILLVEQNEAQALEIADRAYVLENGRTVRTGAAAELLADDSIREAYLGL